MLTFRLFVFLVVAAVHLAQQPVPWPPGADRGNRYEGFLDVLHSSTDVQLLSFLASPIVSDDTPDILRVAFYSPSDATAFVSGRELVDLRQYRMESKPVRAVAGWNEFRWPSSDVIKPARLAPTALGFTVTLSQSGQATRRFAPAVFNQAATAVKTSSYIVVVKSRYTLKSLSYSLIRRSARTESIVRTAEVPATFSAGDPFEVQLDLTGVPEGEVLLRLTGNYAYREGGPLVEYPFFFKSSR